MDNKIKELRLLAVGQIWMTRHQEMRCLITALHDRNAERTSTTCIWHYPDGSNRHDNGLRNFYTGPGCYWFSSDGRSYQTHDLVTCVYDPR